MISFEYFSLISYNSIFDPNSLLAGFPSELTVPNDLQESGAVDDGIKESGETPNAIKASGANGIIGLTINNAVEESADINIFLLSDFSRETSLPIELNLFMNELLEKFDIFKSHP
jgi:hypothetical protein